MFFRSIATALGLRRSRKAEFAGMPPAPDPRARVEPNPDGASDRHQSTPTDAMRRDVEEQRGNIIESHEGLAGRITTAPTRQARPARDHAAALLEWLQGANGRTGSVFADELEAMHREMCTERDWELLGWTAVARELRRLLDARKEYAWRDGKRIRVYRIPPAIPAAKSPAQAVKLVRSI